MRPSHPRAESRTRLRALVALAALAASACSHQVDSPPAKALSVEPGLVCTEQLTTAVTLRGDGLTPMPANTLAGPPRLLLPRIGLSLTTALDGTAAGGATTEVPDDPTAPADSQVHWVSESTMTFSVTDGLLSPGLYDVTVTNPDGKQAATLTAGLLAVPRPTLTGTAPDLLCDAQADQSVTLEGADLLQVGTTLPTVHLGGQDFPVASVDGCVALPGNGGGREVQRCSRATFVIPQGAFAPGTYAVTLTNPAPANCVSSDVVAVEVLPPPVVTSVAPDLVCDAQGDRAMTVTGTDFLQVGAALPTVQVGGQSFTPTAANGCTPVDGTFTEGAVQRCTSLRFTIPQGALAEGDHAVVVQNPPPAGCHSVESVSLHVSPPPSLAAISPVGVCDAQGDQVLTLSGTGFLQVGTTLPAITIGAQRFQPTQATGCVTIAGTFTEGAVSSCTGLELTVPQGTFAEGSYPVTVTNPDPAGCASTESISLEVHAPPVVTGTTPATLCQGGGTLNVAGQNFLSTASVSLVAPGGMTVGASSTQVNPAGTQITATFGGTGTPGDVLDVVVDNGDGCSDPAPHRQVTVVSGPVAFFADPEVVFNGINTRVTIYVTTLMQPLPANAVTIVPSGMTAPVTTLSFNLVAGHPNRVQAIVPLGTAPGSYDLLVNDATGCSTVLPNALTVTATTSVALKSVTPPFGSTQERTAITVLRDTAAPAGMQAPFVATPRLFLNPTNPQPTDVAIQVQSVSFVDQDTLTAVVPANQPAHAYDLIAVNPDGTVGYLADAFTVQSVPPPVVTTVTPSSIVAATGQTVLVRGTNFSGSAISVTCESAGMTVRPPVVSGVESCPGPTSTCSQSATIDGSALASGSVCVLRVTNADGSYFDFSAIGVTNSSLNLSTPQAGTNLQVGRRALVAAAGSATASARFVYAIGGDNGATSGALASTEVASVDLFGHLGAWALQPSSALGTPRTFAGVATIGRYIYVFGGSDGVNALTSAERAMILDPSEVPALDIDDLVPNGVGLDAGYWLYRVAATFSASDPDNPGGESLPSDEFIVKVPAVASKKIQVVLSWTAPTDALGAPLPNVAGYRVYRTPMVNGVSGGEVLLASVTGSTLKFTDDGSATPGTEVPLRLGNTGRWAPLPAMSAARMGPAGAAVVDPSAPGTHYVYALLGKGTGAPRSRATSTSPSRCCRTGTRRWPAPGRRAPSSRAPGVGSTARGWWTERCSPTTRGRRGSSREVGSPARARRRAWSTRRSCRPAVSSAPSTTRA